MLRFTNKKLDRQLFINYFRFKLIDFEIANSEISADRLQINSCVLFCLLTVTLRTGSKEPMTPKYAFISTKRLQIGKMFQETPSEI